MTIRLALLLLGAVLLGSPAEAHRMGTSQIQFDRDRTGDGPASRLRGRLDVPLRDLAQVVPLDANADDAITAGELDGAAGVIRNHLAERVRLSAGSAPLPTRWGEVLVVTLAGEVCASVAFEAAAPGSGPVRLHSDLLFDLDPGHRCLVRMGSGPGIQPALLSPESRSIEGSIPVSSGSARAADPGRNTFTVFFIEGIRHLAMGTDHLLFLLCLLLPGILPAPGTGEAIPAPASLGPVFRRILGVVTAFTAAHSVTLALAALDVVRIPSRIVETLIAGSVGLAAVHNVVPILRADGWRIALGFGLVHGFGFAGVLADLDLPRAGFVQALLAFNLGVEAGQVLFVAAFVPLAFPLRTSWAYRRVAIPVASGLIAVVAGGWVWERALGGG